MKTMRLTVAPGAFRLILAVIVLLHHLTRVSLGLAAVFMFFSLSGFWIYKMWNERYSRANHPYFIYLLSRGWRLYPIFILGSATAMVLEGFPSRGNNSEFHYIFSQLFIFGYHTLGFMPNLPAWSLDIEAQFYLIAPILVWLIQRLKFAPAALGLCVISAVSLGLVGRAMPSYLLFFGFGMLAGAHEWRPSTASVQMSLLSIATVILIILISPFRAIMLGGAHHTPLFAFNDHLNVLLAVLAMPVALFTVHQQSGPIDRTLADMSFALYILHWPMLLRFREMHTPNRPLTTAVFCLVVLATSFIVAKYYDQPINQIRVAWLRKKANRAPEPEELVALAIARSELQSPAQLR